MGQPVWDTDAGSLGTIAEGLFFNTPVIATDPDGGTVKYILVAGELPEGIQIRLNGTIEGVPVPFVRVQGVPSEVGEDITSKFAIRAYVEENGTTRINDRTFTLTVTGQDVPEFTTPAGSLGIFYDGDVIDIDIEFTDQDPDDTVTVSLESGELPPGLTVSSTGTISGYIEPIAPLPDTAIAGYDRDGSDYDEFPFDFSSRSISKNYQFTIKITDGKDQNIRTFEMFVVSRDSLTADTTDFTSDNNDLTADVLSQRTPFISNYPAATATTDAGFIGTFRHDNFFAYQIIGLDLDGDPFEFEIETGDSTSIPPNLIFDRTTGWLRGYFPDQGATEIDYSFRISVYKRDIPSIVSSLYTYSLTIIGDIESGVTWLNGTLVPDRPVSSPIYSLGTINSGAVSLLGIEASTPSARLLQFRLKQGGYPDTPGVYNKLPQGLSLLPTGEIAGRATFNTFAMDSGTTTFDQARSTRLEIDPTTFDQQFDFTVEAYSTDGLISVFRTFRIFLNRAYNTPYESLYIQAMPPNEDRDLIKSLVQNQDIIPPSLLYRKNDPYFGIAERVTYVHAFSLDSATLEEYVQALQLNHFRKRLVVDGIRTAQALDENDEVLYEVVYADIVDTGVNKLGQSTPQSVSTAYPITDADGSTETSTVYPNSLINMRDQVIDTVGQTNVILPLWMTSKQTNGRVLGFTRAWVIAYTQPGESARVAYNIRTEFGEILNRIDFEVDRYTLDRSMTKNWVPNEDSTDGGNWLPALSTTFDLDNEYSVSVTNGGSGYEVGDTLRVLGTSLGGSTTANDLSLTVASTYGVDIVTIDASDSSVLYEVGDEVEALLADSSITQGEITAVSTDGTTVTIKRLLGTPFSGILRLIGRAEETILPDVTSVILSTSTTGGIVNSVIFTGAGSYTAEGNSYAGITPTVISSSGTGLTITVKLAIDTTFDGDSLRFTSPVDNYEFTDKYNKYLVFPKTNILG